MISYNCNWARRHALNAQITLLAHRDRLTRMVALWFDKLVILDPVGASWDTVGAEHASRESCHDGF